MNIIEGLCIASSSIFGMAILNPDELNSNYSGRLVMFNVFLSGSVFFYTYNAYDVSHLFLKDQSRGQSTEAPEDLSIRMKVPN